MSTRKNGYKSLRKHYIILYMGIGRKHFQAPDFIALAGEGGLEGCGPGLGVEEPWQRLQQERV